MGVGPFSGRVFRG